MHRAQLLVASLVVFTTAVFLSSLVRIGPDEVGVRTDNFGLGDKGIVQADFGPGWHVNLPVVHTWTILPARVRRVEMTKDPRHRSTHAEDALLVQSVDGDRVMLDLHIFYRVSRGNVHRLLQDSGSADAHVRVLKSLAKDRLRALFGTLKTEQFYDPAARHEKTEEALFSLREVLEPRFIEVVDVMVQDVEFEPKYEQKIKDKKLADQEGELNKAQTRAVAEKGIVGMIQLDTEKQTKLIAANAAAAAAKVKAEGDKYTAQKRAEADLYRDQLRAKGMLAVAQAEAKVKRAKTAALIGSGGANLAALEAVSQLKIDSIAFPTGGSDWFDVRQMATRLGARP
jgi:regulator of protease activity HflC (stomatin/prohibitin superfamily)